MIESISIIFPAFNEEKRLNDCFQDIEKFLKNSKIENLEFIFVDDGSLDNTPIMIKQFIENKNNFKLIKLEKNIGKGGALINGVLASNNYWVLTLDTDISVSLEELNIWIKENYLDNNKIYFGSRNIKKSKVDYIFFRKFIGLIFTTICKILLNINIKDTQCGFKLYNNEVGKKIFSNLKERGFAHDIEIVLIAKNLNIPIKELPVHWTHKPGSKVDLIKDSLKMLLTIIKLKITSIKL
jgi:dolichyl-phosphate beta-glucosyltransferase